MATSRPKQRTFYSHQSKNLASQNMDPSLPLDILPQPNDWTCGPTCLHAVYRFYGDDVGLQEIIERVPKLDGGGTLAVLLGCDALNHNYSARIYTYNLNVFDPTWFRDGVDLEQKLRQQMEVKSDEKLRLATRGYLNFLSAGGEVRMQDMSTKLLLKYLSREIPILTGLSSTYLYQESREIDGSQEPSDIRGVPQGHFVILQGYDRESKLVRVADPYSKNPWSKQLDYQVMAERVVSAILLGVLTYDANFLVIRPKR